DFHVTGVQTCALPIFGACRPRPRRTGSPQAAVRAIRAGQEGVLPARTGWYRPVAAGFGRGEMPWRGGDRKKLADGHEDAGNGLRSEERRVGKECDSEW